MTNEQKINQIQKLFLSNDKTNWVLVVQLIDSQQLNNSFSEVVRYKGGFSHKQKVDT